MLAATGIFVLSILFAPGRGLVAATVRHLRLRRRIADENAGMALYELAETAGTAAAGFDMRELIGHTADRHLRFALKRLRRRGIAFAQPNGWHLTPAGLEWAYELVRARRLWEVFLMHESDFGDAAADRDAADPVAGLAPPVRQNLARLLKLHGLEPRLRPRRAGDEAT